MNKWHILENITIYIVVFLGVWLLHSYWFFVLLAFVNFQKKGGKE